jgi:ribosomal protein S12 methylthiotransferase accessory factor
MVYSQLGYLAPQERFWFQISAAHVSYEKALLAAIHDVIERDAASITWLQKLPLRRIEVDYLPELLEPYWNVYMRSSKHLEYMFFVATTDLGVPIVYALQISKHNPQATTLVACSAGPSIAGAIAKTMRDLVALRSAFRQEIPFRIHGIVSQIFLMAQRLWLELNPRARSIF